MFIKSFKTTVYTLMRLLFTIEKKIAAYASEYNTNLIEFPKFGFNGQILVHIKYWRKFSQFPTYTDENM